MKKLLLFILLTSISTSVFAFAPIKDAAEFFLKTDAFFKKYAIEGNIKYGDLKKDRTDLVASKKINTE